jgi:hypothetical protein
VPCGSADVDLSNKIEIAGPVALLVSTRS